METALFSDESQCRVLLATPAKKSCVIRKDIAPLNCWITQPPLPQRPLHLPNHQDVPNVERPPDARAY